VSRTIEMRVGMSLYWVKLYTSDGGGVWAMWKQGGQVRKVWSAGSMRDAEHEARVEAERLTVSA